MSAEEAVEGLERAVRARDSAGLIAALPLVDATARDDPAHRAVTLTFLTAFAHTASLTGIDAGILAFALRHASQTAPDSAGQTQLLAIHRALLDRALEAGIRSVAVAVASSAIECMALGEANRVMLLVLLLKDRLDRPAVDLLAKFETAPSRGSLILALEQAHGDVAASALRDAGTLRVAAAWAMAHDPRATWARKALVAALNRLGEFDQALETAAGLGDDDDARTLRAWTLFGMRRFAEAALSPPLQGPETRLVRVLRTLVAVVPAFEAPSPSTLEVAAVSAAALGALSDAGDVVAVFGPAALFAFGAGLARAGRLSEAIDFCRRAVEQTATPGYCYGLIHLMQLAGWWEAASEALETAPRSSSAVVSLWLQQVYHEEGLAGLPAQHTDSLLRARYSLLTGHPCDYVHTSPIFPREAAEETLRINLALAVRARDLGHLQQLMDEPLFLLLPALETEFYRGVFAWLGGDSVAAASKLGRAVELAPDFLPALRCLAAIKADHGDHQAAGASWDRVTQLAPGDGTAFVHRALQFTAAGDISKGTASLRGYCARAPHDERAHYYLARLQLSAAFGRAASAGENWEAVERAARLSAASLDRLANVPEAAWFAWVCHVIQSPPASWSSRAQALIAAEPSQANAVPPIEAQWLRGQLRLLASDTETALDGTRMLAGAAGIRPAGAVGPQLSAACWRVALRVTSADQANRLAECVEPLAMAFPAILKPLDFLAARFDMRPRTPRGPATVANIRTLLAVGDTAALESHIEELRAGTDDNRRLLAGIIALELRAFDVFAQVRVQGTDGGHWEILQTIALAKQGHKDAVGAFCALLDRAAEGKRAWPPGPFLAGVLAFLGAKARKHVRDRLRETLASLPLEVAAGDHDTAICFLRASALLGQSERAVGLLAGRPGVMTWEIRRELGRVRRHHAAQAIEAGNFRLATDMTRDIAMDDAEEPAQDLSGVQQRVRRLAAVGTLLDALSPNKNLSADVTRYGQLAGLLEDLGEAPPRKPSNNEQARDLLRNRLGECRRKQPAEQWQAYFRSLAILHWEWGLAAMKLDPPLSAESVECFHFAHFLWRHLLTHERFWTNFAAGSAVSPDELAGLQERIEAEIFECHREQAHLHLTASDAECCRFHLSCLQRWDEPPQMLFLTPESVSAHAAEGFSREKSLAMKGQAAAAFEGWVDGVLWRARKLRDDPAAREHLPPGINRDYEAAVRVAGEALEVVPDQHRLCMFVLEQLADCAYGLYAAERYADARSQLRRAIPVARQVANEKFRGRFLTGPDGEVIRRVFDYACKLEPDSALLVPLLQEYLHWNGPDADAEQQLHLAAGQAAFEAGDYDTAIEHLQKVQGNQQTEALLEYCRQLAGG